MDRGGQIEICNLHALVHYHLTLCHKTVESQLKIKMHLSWNILDPFPLYRGQDRQLWDPQKIRKKSIFFTNHA